MYMYMCIACTCIKDAKKNSSTQWSSRPTLARWSPLISPDKERKWKPCCHFHSLSSQTALNFHPTVGWQECDHCLQKHWSVLSCFLHNVLMFWFFFTNEHGYTPLLSLSTIFGGCWVDIWQFAVYNLHTKVIYWPSEKRKMNMKCFY